MIDEKSVEKCQKSRNLDFGQTWTVRLLVRSGSPDSQDKGTYVDQQGSY